jgi:hypothetical protein
MSACNDSTEVKIEVSTLKENQILLLNRVDSLSKELENLRIQINGINSQTQRIRTDQFYNNFNQSLRR